MNEERVLCNYIVYSVCCLLAFFRFIWTKTHSAAHFVLWQVVSLPLWVKCSVDTMAEPAPVATPARAAALLVSVYHVINTYYKVSTILLLKRNLGQRRRHQQARFVFPPTTIQKLKEMNDFIRNPAPLLSMRMTILKNNSNVVMVGHGLFSCQVQKERLWSSASWCQRRRQSLPVLRLRQRLLTRSFPLTKDRQHMIRTLFLCVNN